MMQCFWCDRYEDLHNKNTACALFRYTDCAKPFSPCIIFESSNTSIFLRFYWACITRFISVFGANHISADFICYYSQQSIPPPPPYEYFSVKILARFYNTQKQLGDGLIWCVKGPRKIPCRLMNIKRESPNFEDISLAEIGTIQLEFKELARQTGNATYKVVWTSHNALFMRNPLQLI